MLRRRFLSLTAATAAATALPFSAARAVGANMGPLEGHLLDGSDAPWRGSFEQGFYVLQNNQFNSMTIFTAQPATPVAKVSVDVYPSGSGSYSGAGLVFNFDTVKGDWLGVTLQPDGNVGVWVYGGSGSPEKVTELPGQGLRTDVVTRLSVENSEAGVDFLTNGQKSGSFSDRKLLGAHGILASDRGAFYFANFAFA